MDIRECEGYKKLLKAVEEDEKRDNWHNYRQKLEWIVEKAKEYAEVLGVTPYEMLNAWENQRNYWYMNYYNEANQPSLKNKNVYIFENKEEFASKHKEFVCPKCGAITKNPQECSECDWKAYGLFGTLGKGVYVLLKDTLSVVEIFKPVNI